MKAKQVYLTGKERLAVEAMLTLEIKSNIEAEELGIETAFGTDMLKALYEKIAGFEWEDD